ncbi:SGNH hydrolase domain-containing protein [Pseudomonas aeruginosa]|uniref:SGNH hydrolase domain-containing protein n=2 Tax=Pseudomonas aeruginosa TaxID=287 RepID=UPI001CF64F41|nr:SGNH hydrolase domain-containing protein [Pseudomonas aeruginosa]
MHLCVEFRKRYPNLRSADLEQGQPKYASSLYEQHCTPNSYGAADCILGEGDVKVILFGDSHAQSHAAAVQIHNRGAAVGWALGGCPMLVDFSMRDKERERKCQRFNREKLEILSSNYIGVPVVLFNYYQLYMEHNSGSFVYEVDGRGGSHLRASYEAQFESVVCGIAKTHPVYLVKQTPRMPFSVYKGAALQERLFNTKVDFSIPFSEHLRRTVEANRLIDSVAKNCNVKMIDPAPLLCPNGRCLGTLNHEPLYFDDNHLVDAGNKLIQGVFLQVFD